MATNDVEIRITGDSSDAQRAFRDVDTAAGNAERGISSRLSGIGSSLRNVGSRMTVGMTLPIVAGFAYFTSGLMDAQRVMAETEAVVRSTGGAAGKSAQDVVTLAESLGELSGIDPDNIQEAANTMLTFTNIKGDVFDEATESALNMSVALGTDLQSASMQIGKALNDPLAGISALGRAGVQFTDDQKNMIRSMVEAGDVAGAQAVILGELNTQFGGQAEAYGETMPGQIGRMKESFNQAGEAVVSGFMPIMTDVLNVVAGLAEKFTNLSPKTQKLIGYFALAAAVAGPLVTVIGALASVFAFLLSPIGLILLAIAAVAAAFYFAYTRSEEFRAIVDGVIAWIKENVPPIIEQVVNFVVEKFNQLKAWVEEIWPKIQEAITHTINVIKDIVTVVMNTLSALWQAWGDDLLRIAEAAWGFIKTTVENAINVIKNIIEFVLNIINGDWGAAWDNIKAIASTVWSQIRAVIQFAMDLVRGIIGGAISTIQTIWRNGWDAVKNGISGIWNGIKSTISGAIDSVVGFVRGMPGRITSAAAGMWDGIKDAFRSAVNWIIDGWNSLQFEIPGFDPPGPGPTFGGFTLGLPDIPRLARGGSVSRAGLAMVGERGPELLSLNKGAEVRPLDKLANPQPEINIYVQGNVFTEEDLLEFVAKGLQRREARGFTL